MTEYDDLLRYSFLHEHEDDEKEPLLLQKEYYENVVERFLKLIDIIDR